MAPAAMRELLQGLEMEAAAWIYAREYRRHTATRWRVGAVSKNCSVIILPVWTFAVNGGSKAG